MISPDITKVRKRATIKTTVDTEWLINLEKAVQEMLKEAERAITSLRARPATFRPRSADLDAEVSRRLHDAHERLRHAIAPF